MKINQSFLLSSLAPRQTQLKLRERERERQLTSSSETATATATQATIACKKEAKDHTEHKEQVQYNLM